MKNILPIITMAVWLFILIPWPHNDNRDTYRELFSAYDKKKGYYDVQSLLADEFTHEETDLAQRIWNGIDSLHNIEQNKIDSLNNIIKNGN